MALYSVALRYVAEGVRSKRFNSRHTVEAQQRILGNFALVNGDPEPSRVTRAHVQKWLGSVAHLRAASLKTQLSVVHPFCHWLVTEGYLKSNPAREVKSPRAPRYNPRALEEEKIEKLMVDLPDARAELICSLMFQEGLRCCEVANLEVGDIWFSERRMRVTGKGGHSRDLPITDATWLRLRRYLDSCPITAGPLIRSVREPLKGLTAGHISKSVSRWMLDAGIKGRAGDGVSAHPLRHTAATTVLKASGDLQAVQHMLGHASLATTQRYLGGGGSRAAAAAGDERPIR